jgi:hypothetical protein
VVVVVLAAQVVHVAGGHERAADLAGDPDDALVGLVLVGDAVLLDLEEDVLGPKAFSRSSAWARASSGRSCTSRLAKRPARQPVIAMMPSLWRSSWAMSTVGLPRLSPSRKPAELSLTRLR